MALWDQNSLFALSLGRPTYAGVHLRLDFVEARPISAGSRGRVLPEILLAYGIYARLLGAQTIRIMKPINDEVQAYYEANGYQYVSKGKYLFKEII